MALQQQKTIWRPDICRCEVEYIVQNDGSFIGTNVFQSCMFHRPLETNPQLLLNNIITEAKLKNAVFNTLVKELPDTYFIIDPETNRRTIDPTQLQITFEFTPIAKTLTNGGIRKMILYYRLLKLKLTNPQQTQLNNRINQILQTHRWIIDRDLVDFINLG